jgi:hypothetical protein
VGPLDPKKREALNTSRPRLKNAELWIRKVLLRQATRVICAGFSVASIERMRSRSGRRSVRRTRKLRPADAVYLEEVLRRR